MKEAEVRTEVKKNQKEIRPYFFLILFKSHSDLLPLRDCYVTWKHLQYWFFFELHNKEYCCLALCRETAKSFNKEDNILK